MLLLTSYTLHRCYKELSEWLGCERLLPSSWRERRNTVQELSRDPWSIYSFLGLRIVIKALESQH